MRCAALLLAAVVVAACSPTVAALPGTELDGGSAADFTLQDAVSGSSLSLSSLRGSVVALTFLYTSCPDSCPLTAELLRAARDRSGSSAARVQLVAISVDPARDTPQAVRTFSDAHRLSTNWHYLIGRPEQLATVWQAFGVRAEPNGGDPTVIHSDAIYLIDPEGRERALIHTDERPDRLAAAFTALLGGR